MIATHNMKVNGLWIHAGEEYGPETAVTPEKAEPAVSEAEVPEEKPEAKPKTTRRKKVSE